MRLVYKSKGPGAREDYLILAIIGLLTIFGLAMLSSASFDMDKVKLGDTYYHLRHQIIYGLSLGIIGFWIASKIYYKYWGKLSLIILAIGILGVLLTFSSLGIKPANIGHP